MQPAPPTTELWLLTRVTAHWGKWNNQRSQGLSDTISELTLILENPKALWPPIKLMTYESRVINGILAEVWLKVGLVNPSAHSMVIFPLLEQILLEVGRISTLALWLVKWGPYSWKGQMKAVGVVSIGKRGDQNQYRIPGGIIEIRWSARIWKTQGWWILPHLLLVLLFGPCRRQTGHRGWQCKAALSLGCHDTCGALALQSQCCFQEQNGYEAYYSLFLLCEQKRSWTNEKKMLHWIVPIGNLGPWILLPFLANLSSSGSEVLAPESGVLLLGDTANILLNWKLRLSLCHSELWCLKPADQERNCTVRNGDGSRLEGHEDWSSSPQWRWGGICLLCL